MESEREVVFTVDIIGQLEREVSLQFSTDDINATGLKPFSLIIYH